MATMIDMLGRLWPELFA